MTDEMHKIKALKRQMEKEWMSIKDVVGIGIGRTAGDRMGIIVSVKKKSAGIQRRIPAQVQNIPVEIRETGEIKAL